MKFELRWHFVLRSSATKNLLQRHVDDVMRQLISARGHNSDLVSSSIEARWSKREVDIELTIDVQDVMKLGSVVDRGQVIVRTAIHAAGGSTPGWDPEPISVQAIDDDAESLEYAFEQLEVVNA